MIDKLDMFIALAREQHFGRAAESLNIAQPTLSAGIKQLEDQLGVQLVFRGSRYGGLTPEGQAALVWARRIVSDTRRMRDEMRATRHGLSGMVRLAVIPTAQTWAARLATAVTRQHPNVRFTILSRTSREILQMLDAFEAEAGISYIDNEPLGKTETLPLYAERYMVVCAHGTPMADRDRIGWAELDGAALALLTPDMQNRRIIDRTFAACGVTPEIRIESNSIIALVASVAAGRCMAVLPTDIARFMSGGKDLALVPLDPRDGGNTVGLILPRHDPRTPVLKALLTHARALPSED